MHSLCWLKRYVPQILIHAFLWLWSVLCRCGKLLRCCLLPMRGRRKLVARRLYYLELSEGCWLANWCTDALPVITFLISDAIFVLVKSGCVGYFTLAFFASTITWPPTVLVGYISNACTLWASAFVNSKHRAAFILICLTFVCCIFKSWFMIFGRWLSNAKVLTCWLASSVSIWCHSGSGSYVLGR